MSDLVEVYFAPDGARLLLGRAFAAECEIRLCTAWPPTKPGQRLNVSDYPQPDKASGYEPRTVAAGGWQVRIVDGGVVAEAPMQIFRLRGQGLDADQVAGYLVVDRTSGQLIGAGRYRLPIMIARTGLTEIEVVARHFHATSPLPRSA